MEVVMEGVPVVERLYEVCRLWAAWAKELEFEDLDIDAFGKETMSKMANGTESSRITSTTAHGGLCRLRR